MNTSKIKRIGLIAIGALVLLTCSMTPLEAGLAGVATGAVTTMVLDSEPNIVVDGATSSSNAFSFLEVLINNAWSLAFLGALLWLLPNPSGIKRLVKKWRARND